jgi:hypothetical protein
MHVNKESIRVDDHAVITTADPSVAISFDAYLNMKSTFAVSLVRPNLSTRAGHRLSFRQSSDIARINGLLCDSYYSNKHLFEVQVGGKCHGLK